MIGLILILLVVFLVYKFHDFNTRNSDYFEKRGVKNIVRRSFFNGFLKIILQKISMVDIVNDIYSQHPEEKYINFFLNTLRIGEGGATLSGVLFKL